LLARIGRSATPGYGDRKRLRYKGLNMTGRRLTFGDISSKSVRMAELVVVNDFKCFF
jgi:hypothetical protein